MANATGCSMSGSHVAAQEEKYYLACLADAVGPGECGPLEDVRITSIVLSLLRDESGKISQRSDRMLDNALLGIRSEYADVFRQLVEGQDASIYVRRSSVSVYLPVGASDESVDAVAEVMGDLYDGGFLGEVSFFSA